MGKLMKKTQSTHPILDELKRKQSFKLRELIDYANRLTPFFIRNQRDLKYRGPLGERTVRYYVSENLIDKPAGYKGSYAIFSYRHILQALVIGYLRSNERTLKEIFEMTRNLKNKDLETILVGKDRDRAILSNGKTLTDSKALSSSDLFPSSNPTQGNVWAPSSRFDDRLWRRFRINDGLELHVIDHPAVSSSIDINNTANAIVEILTKIKQRGFAEATDWDPVYSVQSDDQERDLDKTPPGWSNLPHKVIALVTEGGLVPLGNPDRLESAKSKRFLRYSLRGIDDFRSNAFESVSGGWDSRYINADPDRLLPLDVMREIENKASCLSVHEYFYTTTGVAMSLEVAKKIGENIAQELKEQGVSAVIFTST
jgi:DNA-binding transcriptional MerR regulator